MAGLFRRVLYVKLSTNGYAVLTMICNETFKLEGKFHFLPLFFDSLNFQCHIFWKINDKRASCLFYRQISVLNFIHGLAEDSCYCVLLFFTSLFNKMTSRFMMFVP